MAITLADFNKIWASTSPLTPYSFSESNYKQGWNFIGSTPPARQMWDFLQKQNDEKMQYIVNDICVPTEIDETSASGDYYSYPVPTGKVFANFKTLGGKTIAWNQLADIPQNATYTQTISAHNYYEVKVLGSIPIGHIIYFTADYTSSVQGCPVTIVVNGSGYSPQGYSGAKYPSRIEVANNINVRVRISNYTEQEQTVTISNLNVKICDLTLMFGAGNEPSQSVFESMFPASYYAYTEGTLVSAGIKEVISKDSSNNVVATMPIPSAVQSLEGYGWSAGSVKNEIDFVNKKFIKRVGKVVLDGTQSISIANWQPTDNGVGWIYSYNATNNKVVDFRITPNITSTKYTANRYESLQGYEVGISVYYSNAYGIVIWQTDTSLNTVSAINTYLSANPITVYYELATPVETDISSILGAVGIACGNTLTFNYDTNYRLKVPVSMDLLDGTNGLMTPQDKAKLDVAYGALSADYTLGSMFNLKVIEWEHTFSTTDYEEVVSVYIPPNCVYCLHFEAYYTNSKPSAVAITHATGVNAVNNSISIKTNSEGIYNCSTEYNNYTIYGITLHLYAKYPYATMNKGNCRYWYIKTK